MNTCHTCGSCGNCSGCAKELILTPEEAELLANLAQVAFLPIARKTDDMTPVYLEDAANSPQQYSLVIASLERKGLIDLDYRQPLSGFDYGAYTAYPVRGSIALTARGQTVAEWMELQGIQQEP